MSKISDHVNEVLNRSNPQMRNRIPRQQFLKWIGRKSNKTEYRWAMNLLPNDIINGCSTFPFNTKIVSAKIIYANLELYDTGDGYSLWSYGKESFGRPPANNLPWIVKEVETFDIHNHCHIFPGGSCVESPYEIEKIIEILKEYNPDEIKDNDAFKQKLIAIQERIYVGKEICDEYGCEIEY